MRRNTSHKLVTTAAILAGALLGYTYIKNRKEKSSEIEKGTKQVLLPKVEQKQIQAPQNYSDMSHRQKTLYDVIKEKKVLTPAEIHKIFPEISTRTLRRDMDALVKSGKVTQNGTTKSTIYKYKK